MWTLIIFGLKILSHKDNKLFLRDFYIDDYQYVSPIKQRRQPLLSCLLCL